MQSEPLQLEVGRGGWRGLWWKEGHGTQVRVQFWKPHGAGLSHLGQVVLTNERTGLQLLDLSLGDLE